MKKNLCHVLLFLIGCLPLLAMTPKQTTPMDKPIYSVDFNGMNFAFKDVRTGQEPTGFYAAGDTVMLTFEMQAYDVSYTFYLDGKELNASTVNDHFCYNFIMPDHDVKLTWKSRNLMEEKE